VGLYGGDVEVYKLPLMNCDKDPNEKLMINSMVNEFKTKEINTSYYRIHVEKIKKQKDFKSVFEDFLSQNQAK
jgi:hypothetical protein